MGLLSRLLRPLDYIRIRQHYKIYYDLYYPLVLATIMTGILVLLPVQPPITGANGLIKIITDILQMLSGFYIASLAAIATFNKEGMDELMEGTAPTLKVSRRGKILTDPLTRRRFLCLLFGYLALLSLFLYFLGAGSSLISVNTTHIITNKTWLAALKWGFVWCYLFFASNLVVTTLLGLFYMVDRIHRKNANLQHANPEEA